MEKASLRPDAAVEKARDLAELWHWRARVWKTQQQEPRSTGGVDLQEAVSAAAANAFEKGDIPEPVDGDFPIFGKAYSELSAEEHAEANSIAIERHYALNWLCGYAGDWDSVPTEISQSI